MPARIQEVAEEHFRRIGHHKTSVADIASELGMSRANIYRFFPSRDAIRESICRRVLNGTAELALTIARRSTPPSEKLKELLTAVHHQNKTKLLHDRQMHDLIVAAMQENRPVIKVHADDDDSRGNHPRGHRNGPVRGRRSRRSSARSRPSLYRSSIRF
ncbi:TetR/AcrR family transcriptional regulator [Sinorhizobium meliloti]|uniref:TetR/AcrR family transcriptional regulator n=1 Tax=Rhizobium meliloti TaxID=382 RepID=UPI002D790B2E|nr:TetR/AcrR family transcriptional regulator [Sinorhizobium meliloti]